MDLRGAVVVVTGASSGFGELATLRFAANGADVVAAARRLERLEALAERIEALGRRALAVQCDVTSVEDLRRLRDVVQHGFGRCNVLVNNAGIPGGGRFEDLTVEQIENVIRVNVLGVMHATSVFLPMMLRAGRGHVVNVASLAGLFTTPGASVYGASKHAVVAFSESLFHELEGSGVRVTAVAPGFARTEGFPMTHTPRALVMKAETVADAIVDAVRLDRGPLVTVPRGVAPLQAFRALTPRPYRWGVRRLTRRLRSTPAKGTGA